MGLKEISGSTSKVTVQPALQKDEDEAKKKLKQAELQVGTVWPLSDWQMKFNKGYKCILFSLYIYLKLVEEVEYNEVC